MEVIFLLIGCSVFVAASFLFAFIWAVRSGQYDDCETPAIRMLFDEGSKPKQTSQIINKKIESHEPTDL